MWNMPVLVIYWNYPPCFANVPLLLCCLEFGRQTWFEFECWRTTDSKVFNLDTLCSE